MQSIFKSFAICIALSNSLSISPKKTSPLYDEKVIAAAQALLQADTPLDCLLKTYQPRNAQATATNIANSATAKAFVQAGVPINEFINKYQPSTAQSIATKDFVVNGKTHTISAPVSFRTLQYFHLDENKVNTTLNETKAHLEEIEIRISTLTKQQTVIEENLAARKNKISTELDSPILRDKIPSQITVGIFGWDRQSVLDKRSQSYKSDTADLIATYDENKKLLASLIEKLTLKQRYVADHDTTEHIQKMIVPFKAWVRQELHREAVLVLAEKRQEEAKKIRAGQAGNFSFKSNPQNAKHDLNVYVDPTSEIQDDAIDSFSFNIHRADANGPSYNIANSVINDMAHDQTIYTEPSGHIQCNKLDTQTFRCYATNLKAAAERQRILNLNLNAAKLVAATDKRETEPKPEQQTDNQ